MTNSKVIKSSTLLKNYETNKLPKQYTRDLAQKNGDVVVSIQGGTINEEKFTGFIENVNKKKKDKVRITSYTTEGGAIITDLIYDGRNILIIQDTTRDGFGTREIRQYKASRIEQDGTRYYAVVSGEKFSIPVW